MATGGLTPIRGNDAYIGWGKQAAWGTAIAPTNFWRWLDGTAYGPDTKETSEREGDTSPFIILTWKDSQMGMVKVIEYARPITSGCALQAVMGDASDTYSAPTFATTLAAAITAGATTFQSTVTLGTVGTLVIAVEGGYSSTTAEIVTVDLTTHTGSGPFTYTLASSATFKLSHSNGGSIVSQASHVFTRQTGAYDPYTLEFAFGHNGGSPSQAIRLQDAVCTQLKISGSPNKPIRFEHDWYGAIDKIAASLSTPTYEGVGTMGTPTAPFKYNQGGSSWSIDSSTSGNATSVAKFDLTLKNSTDPSEFITEGLNPAFFQPANFDIDANLDVVFQSFNQWNNAFFGSASAGSGTADAILVGLGAFAVTLTADSINSLAFSLPNVAYAGPKMTPKLDGKALHMPLVIKGQKGQAVTNPLTITLTNAQNSQY